MRFYTIIIAILYLTAALSCQAEQVPEFSWQELDGKTHAIAELKGHPVIIHFWASWCVPCKIEFPAMLAAAQNAQKEVTFLTISSDEDKSKAQAFIRHAQEEAGVKPDNVRYAFDPDKTLTFDLFQTLQYPETIVLDSKLNMFHKFAGTVDWDKDVVRTGLKQLP